MRVPGRGAEDFLKIFLYHPSRELTHSYIRVLHLTADRLINRHPCCPKYIPFSRNIGTRLLLLGAQASSTKNQKKIFFPFFFFFFLKPAMKVIFFSLILQVKQFLRSAPNALTMPVANT